MSTIKTYDGVEHTVTDEWFLHNGQYAGTQDQHEIRRQQLLRQSEIIPLGPGDEAELQAITRWQNINRAWSLMSGRDYHDFGFSCIDQVHHNRHRPGCGCILNFIFDHNLAQAGKPHERIAHYPSKSCDKHAHLMDDFKAHHDMVLADNR